MMKTVKEISRLTGISVRTLHYYDEINLLKPSRITDAGYRMYDDTELERLHRILLFRELKFPLKEIKTILDNPDFDSRVALQEQIAMLEMQKNRLDEIIHSAREILMKGVENMNFSVFDKTEIEKYADEARQKWRNTDEFKEYEQKHSGFTDNADEFMRIFAQIGKLKHLAPDSETVQLLIRKLQNFITDNYYTCTDKMLNQLGQMYVADERFKNNIDKAGGKGTTEFVVKAIQSLSKID